jgi:hypothetical protein
MTAPVERERRAQRSRPAAAEVTVTPYRSAGQ